MAELHIASLAVHARPERLEVVRAQLDNVPGVEVHGASPLGKLVFVVEAAADAGILERLTAIRDLPGVLAAHLVFHRILPDDTLEARA